jgi:hypothetical protein
MCLRATYVYFKSEKPGERQPRGLMAVILFPLGEIYFSFNPKVQTGCGALSTVYPKYVRGSFLRRKSGRGMKLPKSSIVELYFH